SQTQGPSRPGAFNSCKPQDPPSSIHPRLWALGTPFLPANGEKSIPTVLPGTWSSEGG
ncbi:hypothetical protein P7K49_011455, partial [Saguinus oedipus]